MNTRYFLRPVLLCLLTAFLSTGLTSCSPSVSEIEFNAARAKVESTEARLAKLETEVKALAVEAKQLNTFTGPDHEREVKRAGALLQEKTDLETIKTQVDSKVAHFIAEAQRHRDALAKEKP